MLQIHFKKKDFSKGQDQVVSPPGTCRIDFKVLL